MIRLAVLGLHHETNTFSTVPADLAAYRAGGVHRGAEFAAHYRDSQATFGGYLNAGQGEEDVQAVPLMDAIVNPCGMVSRAAYDELVGEMMGMLAAQGPFDGVLLGLHGACVAVGHPSADADIADRAREVVGPDVPIGSVLDMHANVDPRLARTLDVLLAYQTNPHVDPRRKAAECRRLLIDLIRCGRRPAIVVEQLPLVVTITAQDTATAPMSDLLAIAELVEAEPGMIDVSILEGFPYADVPHMGMTVLATHQDEAAARSAARRVAAAIWDRRAGLQGDAVRVEDAVAALASGDRDSDSDGKPVLVLDVGDNIGGGGPGDSTVLLAAILARRVPGVVGTLFDPGAVAELSGADAGDRVSVTAGGHAAEQDGQPVTLTGVIAGRHAGVYEADKVAHGGFRYFDGGEMIAIRDDDGPTVVLTSKLVPTVTPVQLEVVGLDPASFRAIIGKGVNAPRAGYADVCGGLLVVDTPGVTRNSLDGFGYTHRRRPMYPFEQDAVYPAR
jgi:microcystin degradation protein MlrC